MEKFEGKEKPWEEQKALLTDMVALTLPKLHLQLVGAYGEEKGQEIFDTIYEMEFLQRTKQFEGKDIGDVMIAELDLFPSLGWKVSVEKTEENGEPVWIEHLSHCPPLAASKKYNLPLPCEVVCGTDVKFAEKHRVGKWERLKHMPSGDSECCFKITRFK